VPSLAAAPLEARVWINEYLKPTRRLVTKYGDVTQIKPERDPNVPLEAMREVQIDPAAGIAKGAAGYGYTGRVLGVGPVILLSDDVLNQCLQWQARTGQPWPYGGVLTSFDPNTRNLFIAAANGSWRWQVVPAYWPTMREPAAWCVGLLEAGEVPT
jgi:hypothetical protein